MNLSFATKFPAQKKGLSGKPTMFVEKIFQGLNKFQMPNFHQWHEYIDKCEEEGVIDYNYLNDHFGDDDKGKIHTIRRDEKNRWNNKKYIHFSIWKGRPYHSEAFNFAPVIQCTGKERIKISYWSSLPKPLVMIGDTVINMKAIEQLAFNDGFDSVEDFFSWFDSDFDGWIIHWTPFRYEVNEIEVILD